MYGGGFDLSGGLGTSKFPRHQNKVSLLSQSNDAEDWSHLISPKAQKGGALKLLEGSVCAHRDMPHGWSPCRIKVTACEAG